MISQQRKQKTAKSLSGKVREAATKRACRLYIQCHGKEKQKLYLQERKIVMNRTKTTAAILSLALIGAVSVPTLAAGPVTAGYTFRETVPVISPYDPAVIEADTLSRAQLIAALHEKEGKPVVNYAMDYTDVAPDAEYAEAVRWAASEQIACGYGDGKFGPDDPVTREQLAVILYRYAQKQGLGFSGNWAFPLDYSDADQISSYAYEPVCWLTMHGVLSDVGDDTFAQAAR